MRCQHPLLLEAYAGSGMLFQNRYSIISKIGVGGFGAVYKASDTRQDDSLVAIKEACLRELTAQQAMEVADVFQREADLLSELTHPSLPRMYEQIREPERLYLVMDFLAGETLEDYQLKSPDRRLVLSEVFDIGLQLCDVLEYLHMHQPPIIFRDLKPTNIMRTPEGKLYVIDFGIARFFKPGRPRDTIALGSPGYAAPEQYGRAQTTPRADIYSLGAILHQLLTGKDPSESPFRFAPLRRASTHSPGSLNSSMVETMMDSLAILIDSMVELEQNKRPVSIAFVKQELHLLAKMWA
ncbi:MAG TPA: serine/threonine-protein kinase, partial [Ktedonobacteraceae bacterium]|nr:serine/threonine-protein kinase [Ktedonobacteraceae bacterium]